MIRFQEPVPRASQPECVPRPDRRYCGGHPVHVPRSGGRGGARLARLPVRSYGSSGPGRGVRSGAEEGQAAGRDGWRGLPAGIWHSK